MNDTELTLTEQESQKYTAPVVQGTPQVATNGNPPADAKQLRTEHVGKLLGEAYMGASTLKLKAEEAKKLREDFPDTDVEIRPHDGIIYISHMAIRERLWNVLGIGNVAEICRERFMRPDSNEIAVDLVLMIRGSFAAEAVGTSKYYPNNPKGSFGDTVESAWSEALRRCAKKFGVATQVWRPGYVRDWIEKNAESYQFFDKRKQENVTMWRRKSNSKPAPTPEPARKGRDYTLKEPTGFQKMKAAVQATPEEPDDVPF